MNHPWAAASDRIGERERRAARGEGQGTAIGRRGWRREACATGGGVDDRSPHKAPARRQQLLHDVRREPRLSTASGVNGACSQLRHRVGRGPHRVRGDGAEMRPHRLAMWGKQRGLSANLAITAASSSNRSIRCHQTSMRASNATRLQMSAEVQAEPRDGEVCRDLAEGLPRSDVHVAAGRFRRCGEMWGDMVRYGEIWGGAEKCEPRAATSR